MSAGPSRAIRAALLAVAVACGTAAAAAEPVDDRIRWFWSTTVAADEAAIDAICLLCSIRVEGRLEGDAIAVGGNVTVLGTVEGDVIVAGGDVTLHPGAVVDGDAIVVGGYLERAPGAAVVTDTVELPPLFHLPGQRAFHWQGMLSLLAGSLAVALLVGAVLRRRRLHNLAASWREQFVLAPVVGMVLLTVTSVALGFSGVLGSLEGWTNAALISLLVGAFMLGHAGLAYVLGGLRDPESGFVTTLAAGSAGMALALLVPVLGALVLCLTVVLGFGGAVVSGLGSRPGWLLERMRRRESTGPAPGQAR